MRGQRLNLSGDSAIQELKTYLRHVDGSAGMITECGR